ncbi:MAG: hypothetical protein A2157_04380 [Deltaproteobacteria bacterium RBG_16_47_11]|nr:MAG: hypothetical protein A2157_04380 [Deltaproteobacteria bacterium RBG_16_47_11]
MVSKHFKTFSLRTSLLIMGLSSIVAQITLMRELLVSFYGNELTLGIILANWLILEASGSFFLGKTVEKTEKKKEIFVLLQLVFSLTFPTSVYLSRVFKDILVSTPGEAIGFAPIFYSSFLILLPVALPHGALFTYGSKLYGLSTKEDASSVGKVYIFETIGIILGGLLMTYLLIRVLNSFEIAFTVSLTNALISVCLLWRCQRDRNPLLRKGLRTLSGLFSLCFMAVLFSTTTEKIHWSSIRSQWREIGVIHYENSIHGNITVSKKGEQYTFFFNGIPTITAPVPDIASVEDFVHLPMLLHGKPESILILSGGVGGAIHEILKHPVSRIDYVELDPLLLNLVKQFSTPLTQSELSDPRVRIHYTDGRFFINRTPEQYDLIFIGLPAPQDLQTNRFFSNEFFSIAKRKLNLDGILVLTLPGSLTYLSKELKDLNGCILNTLKRGFPFVRIIPGDTNLYLASNSNRIAGVTAGEMYRRLLARGVRTRLITQGYLEFRLQERWLNWYRQSMEGTPAHINSDFRPLGVFFGLSYWNALFSPYLTGIFQGFERFTFKLTLPLLTIFSLLMALIFIKKPHTSIQSVPYAIFTTGLTGIIFNLAIIFTFQTLYGYLYHQIGLLVAIFMMGIAVGSLFMTTRLNKIKREFLLFLGAEFAIILFSFLLPLVFVATARHIQGTATGGLGEAIFWILSFLSGVLMGLQFPLAIKIYLRDRSMKGTFGRTAGLIYGIDLLGGFLGGLFGGVLLLPILGLKATCFLMAMIKTSSFLLFFLFTKVRK